MWFYKRNILRFSTYQKTNQIVEILVKNGSPTAETPVWVKENETSLNSFWMLGDCLVERLSLGIVLKYESCSSS